MNEILQQIGNLGIVPVVKIDNAKDAVPLAQALKDGGLPLAEEAWSDIVETARKLAIPETEIEALIGGKP